MRRYGPFGPNLRHSTLLPRLLLSVLEKAAGVALSAHPRIQRLERSSDLRRERLGVASMRRGVQARARVLLPSQPPLRRPAHRGWAYQLVAQLGFERDRWVAPVDARRVRPAENTDEAAEQVRALVQRLPEPKEPYPSSSSMLATTR
jgi:hypothetical protein